MRICSKNYEQQHQKPITLHMKPKEKGVENAKLENAKLENAKEDKRKLIRKNEEDKKKKLNDNIFNINIIITMTQQIAFYAVNTILIYFCFTYIICLAVYHLIKFCTTTRRHNSVLLLEAIIILSIILLFVIVYSLIVHTVLR